MARICRVPQPERRKQAPMLGGLTQRERVAHLTARGEAAIEAGLPYWRKERTTALVRSSAIGEFADQLDAVGAQIPA